MEKHIASERLSADDRVRVEIEYDGKYVRSYEGSGFNSLEAAVSAACREVAPDLDPETLVFRITDLRTGRTHRYCYNAHGNLKLV